MKFISWNVNGIRACENKGGISHILEKFHPDIMAIQETKGDDARMKDYTSTGDIFNEYMRYHQGSSFKGGYAGVGILLKKELIDKVIDSPIVELGNDHRSGRILRLDFPSFTFINVYTLNSGNKDELRQIWDNQFRDYIKSIDNPVIIMGDLNVVHEDKDYWGNLENNRDSYPGLMQYECDGFEKLCKECNLVDSFRLMHPQTRCYSWFSYQFNAYNRNHGWRLDYALVSESINNLIIDSTICDNERYSDHCPIVLDMNFQTLSQG